MNQIKIILSQLKELYLKMTGPQRLSIVAFAGIFLMFITFLLIQATSGGEDKVLFWSVQPSKAAEITGHLRDMSIETTYKNGAIFVEHSADIDAIRMSLAQEDLLPEDLSYDFQKLLTESSFTRTKDERKQRYYMALQTELAKNIRKMDSVVDATVFISDEEESPLLVRHQPRKASVQVSTRGKRRLSKTSVAAIAKLVASAIKGLEPEKVSISDTKGRNYDFDGDDGPSEKWAMERREEKLYKQKIEDHLSSFIPKVIASVEVDMDLRKKTKEVKDYQHADLNKGSLSVLSHNFQEKETSSSKEGSQGVVGAGTNSQAEIKEGDGGNEMKSAKSTKKEDFDSSLVQEFITEDSKMRIKSVSVVVVNKKINPNFNSNLPRDENNLEYIDYDWTKEKEKGNPTLEGVVSDIIGVPMEMITITQQDMLTPTTPVGPSTWEKFSSWINSTLLLMLALSLGAAFLLRSMIRKAQPEEDILPMPDYEEENQESALPPLAEPEADPKVVQIEKRIKEIIEDDPARAASLIRNWLSGD